MISPRSSKQRFVYEVTYRKMLLDGIITVKRVFGQNMLNNTGMILLLKIIKSTDEEAEYDQVNIDVS